MTDCCGRHRCEPSVYPESLAERWVCPDCGTYFAAFDAHADSHLSESHLLKRVLRHIPAGTLGWRSVRLGPDLATATDVISGTARYADTPGGHADRRTLAVEANTT